MREMDLLYAGGVKESDALNQLLIAATKKSIFRLLAHLFCVFLKLFGSILRDFRTKTTKNPKNYKAL